MSELVPAEIVITSTKPHNETLKPAFGTAAAAANAREALVRKREANRREAERAAYEVLAEYAKSHSPADVERYAVNKQWVPAYKKLLQAQYNLAASGKAGSPQAFRLMRESLHLAEEKPVVQVQSANDPYADDLRQMAQLFRMEKERNAGLAARAAALDNPTSDNDN